MFIRSDSCLYAHLFEIGGHHIGRQQQEEEWPKPDTQMFFKKSDIR
jgi:hypothetical protein